MVAFAAALWLLPVSRLTAADAPAKMQPVVVVSLASYDELFHDLDFIGSVSDNPDLAKGLEGLIAMFTQWQGLVGLDKTKPLGAAVTTDGGNFQILGFVPVKDLKKLYSALAGAIGEPDDAGDGVSRFNTASVPVYVKQQGGWAFIGQSPESLTDLPEDPAKLLGDLTKSYDIGVRVHLQNIPEVFRQLAMDQLKAGVQAGLEKQQQDQDDAQAEVTKKLVQHQVEQMMTAFNQIDQLTVGFDIDASGRRSLFDISITALPESDLAKQLTAEAPDASKFSGFLASDALLKMHFNATVAEDDADNLATAADSFKTQVGAEIDKSDDLDDDKEKAAVKDMVNEAIDLVVASLKTGVANGGARISGDGPFTVVLGGYFADGLKLEGLFKKAAEYIEDDDDEDAPKVKLDVAKEDGLRFHTITMPWEDDDNAEMAEAMLGENLVFTLGFGSESAFVALGPNGVKAIQDIIANPAKSKVASDSQLQLSVALAPILKFASQQKNADPLLGPVADGLQKSGKDHVLLTVSQITNGALYRLETEEGVLKLLGVAVKAAAAQRAGGGQ
jgi:hypothetical protein